MTVIESKQLTRQYGRKRALNGVTINIHENTITGLIGRNGAGKTTLLNVLAGKRAATSGDVRVLGKRPFHDLYVSSHVIYIHDDMVFPNVLTLDEIFVEANRFYENWNQDLALSLADYFELDLGQLHDNLSKGKKSTFNTIIGLASRCAVTLFDEPTTGMDAAVRKDMYRAFLKDYLAYPRTMIISSHHVEELEDILEDILLIEQGRVFLHQPIDQLKESVVTLSGKPVREWLDEGSSSVETGQLSDANIKTWLSDKEVIHTETVGSGDAYVVVKHRLANEEIDMMKRAGITLSIPSLSDVCVYLTERRKGGIDDVFDRDTIG